MLTAATWNEASYSYGGGLDALRATLSGGRKPFDTTHAGRDMSKAEIAATFTTTARRAAEGGVHVSAGASAQAVKMNEALLKTVHAPAAGGAGSVHMDRGKMTRGVSG